MHRVGTNRLPTSRLGAVDGCLWRHDGSQARRGFPASDLTRYVRLVALFCAASREWSGRYGGDTTDRERTVVSAPSLDAVLVMPTCCVALDDHVAVAPWRRL